MRLKQVIYWSYPYDLEDLDLADVSYHLLNGEIALVDEEGTATYWSWEQSTDSYDSTIFSIRSRALSFFTPDSLVSRDMSSHPWWLPFVGAELTFRFVDPDEQVLEIASPAGKIYFSTYEEGRLGGDFITVSPTWPISA